MKRLLFFMHTASSIGGVETWLDRVSGFLSPRGFEPVVGLVRGMKYNQPERYKQHHPQLSTLEVDGRGLNRDGRVRALGRAIAKVRPAIVLPLGIVDANEAVIRAKRGGGDVRLLGRAQGNLEPMLADLRLYREWMDRVICPGRLTRKLLVDWAGYPEARVENIPNGADEPVARRNPRTSGQPLRLGYVGRLSQPDKRSLDLIALCRELELRHLDYTLDIVGDGPCRPELEAGLAPWMSRIRLHGAVAHDELYRTVFPNLDVLVMTSASEAFGIVLVEALMHGVVPVSSRYHGFHSECLVIEGETGLAFDVGDMASAADAVQALDLAPDRLTALSQRAECHGRNYSWTRSMERWQSALTNLAGEPPVVGAAMPTIPGQATRGRLERLGLPPSITDMMRRARRATFGPAVEAGGEEWPLYHRHHSRDVLAEVRTTIEALDLAP